MSLLLLEEMILFLIHDWHSDLYHVSPFQACRTSTSCLLTCGDFPARDLQVLFARLYTFHFQTFAGHVTVPLKYRSWFFQYLSSLFLNVFIVGAFTTVSGSLFHLLDTLNVNAYFLLFDFTCWWTIMFELILQLNLNPVSFINFKNELASLS
jgi:hypothetical protein